MKQRSDEWHEARVGKITGSRVGAILGKNPYKSATDVLREMVREALGAEREFTGNEKTQWGEDHEPVALNWYEDTYGYIVQEYGFVTHPTIKWMGYSPDGTHGEGVGRELIEIKCPYSQKIPAKIPAYYMAQVQHGMHVMDIKKTNFIYWTPDGGKVFPVKRNEKWLKNNKPVLDDFHDAYLRALEDPETYLEPLVFHREDNDFEKAVSAYVKAKQAQEEAKVALDLRKQELIEVSNGKNSEGFGVKVTSVLTKGRTSYDMDALQEAYPDIDLDNFMTVGKTSSSFRITVEKSDGKEV